MKHTTNNIRSENETQTPNIHSENETSHFSQTQNILSENETYTKYTSENETYNKQYIYILKMNTT
jgi:hypothetical protein